MMKVYQLYEGSHEEENPDYYARMTFSTEGALRTYVDKRIAQLRRVNRDLVVHKGWQKVKAERGVCGAHCELVLLENEDAVYPGDNMWHHFLCFEVELDRQKPYRAHDE